MYGYYKFLTMPFGLTNILIAFMDIMNKSPLPNPIGFIDDILVYFKSKEGYEYPSRIIPQTLRKKKLFAKLSKYEFWLDSIIFFGHVTKEGVSIDLKKIEVVVD